MSRRANFAITAALAAALAGHAYAQLGLFSKQQRIDFTSEWKGDRFEDGRPKVPDETIDRLRNVSAEDAWGVLRRHNFRNQFESGWKIVNPGEKRLVGRVVTAVFMPLRPDVNTVINRHAKQEGRVARGQNSWVIDTLKKGDVLVWTCSARSRTAPSPATIWPLPSTRRAAPAWWWMAACGMFPGFEKSRGSVLTSGERIPRQSPR